MKKTLVSAALSAALMACAGGAMAASMSPELKVKGEMAVPSCQVALGNGGVFDLGKISNSLIKPTTSTELAKTSGTLAVTCEAETFLNFTVTDNREGTASVNNGEHFGLGNVNGTGKLGYYKVAVMAASVNGLTSPVFSVSKGGSSFSATTSAAVDKNKVTGWAKSANVQNSGKTFAAVLMVTPVLASSKDMGGSIADNVKLDGSATLNFAYGL
ncbi:TPA: DUF1120 domain-containing protein [Serratia marcescens]